MLRLFAAVVLTLLATSNALSLGTESFGSKPLSDVNYVPWPNVMPVINDEHRVYHSWVNGDEHFCFAGDTAALNDAIEDFAAIGAENLVIVLRPGPGKTSSLTSDRTVTFNWDLHLLGGISKMMSTLELGKNIWDPSPRLQVYVGDAIKLDEVEIPNGVEVLEIADLQTRYAKCLASDNRTVRGWSCGHIARLDPYDTNSMHKIATKLDDDDNWVKLNAAGALSQYAIASEVVIKQLQAVKTNDEQLQARVSQTLEDLQRAEPDEAAQKEYQQTLASIHNFVVELRKKQ
jgi:hypothetical protein